VTTAEDLADIQQVCGGASCKTEGGQNFVYFPVLAIRVGENTVTRDALLTLQAHGGYASRLFLSAPIPERGAHWTTHTVLGRTWHTPSWNYVAPKRCIEMLLDHLKVYR
jgi:hypothetical protein